MTDDRDEHRREDEPQQPDAAPVACRLSWWQGVLLVLLLNSTFFYQGCDRNNTYLTVGTASPFLVVAVDDDSNLPSRLLSFSPVHLIVGLGLTIAPLVVICRFIPWLSRLLASRTFWVALSLSVAVLNSFLVSPYVWSHIVRLPTMYLIDLIELLLYDESSPPPPTLERVDIVIAARLYLLLLVVALYSLMRLVSFVLRRFVLVDPDRWWQFRLGGLMATVVILGTGIGLVVRLILQNG